MILSNKFELCNKIGQGNFGKVYRAVNVRTQEEVAIKIEPFESSSLKNEARVLHYMQGITGFPALKWFGAFKREFHYLVLPLLGESLADLHATVPEMPMHVVVPLGKQMFQRIKDLHGKGLLHRDIKPENFLLDCQRTTLYLIDFGFCKRYTDDQGKHIECRQINRMVGTPKFVSKNVLLRGMEPSRRDDVESIVNVLLYLHGDNDHEIFTQLLEDIRELSFEEEPAYDVYIQFLDTYQRAG